MKQLREFDQAQHVFLTATLPPTMCPEFNRAMLLMSPKYLRQSTRRSNISYNIFVGEDSSSVDSRATQLVAAVPSSSSSVVYCRSKWETEYQANRLGCQYYFSGSPGGEEVLSRWLQGELRVIVATGALGLGVDVANVALVIHVGRPYGLIDFVQESGRAGRAGQPASSWVLTCTEWKQSNIREADTHYFAWDPSAKAIHNWMNSTDCRRALQGRFIDGVDAVSCGQVDPDELTCGVSTLFTEDLQPTGLEQISQAPQPPIPDETPSLLEPRLMPIRDSILMQMSKKEYERHDKFGHDILPKSPRGMHIVHAL